MKQAITRKDIPDRDVGSTFAPAKTPIRCPECRSRSFTLNETLTASTQWVVMDGLLNLGAGFHEPGEAFRLDAVCDCGHRWRVRTGRRYAVQITCVTTELDPETFEPVQ